jgi:hypothetical protein
LNVTPPLDNIIRNVGGQNRSIRTSLEEIAGAGNVRIVVHDNVLPIGGDLPGAGGDITTDKIMSLFDAYRDYSHENLSNFTECRINAYVLNWYKQDHRTTAGFALVDAKDGDCIVAFWPLNGGSDIDPIGSTCSPEYQRAKTCRTILHEIGHLIKQAENSGICPAVTPATHSLAPAGSWPAACPDLDRPGYVHVAGNQCNGIADCKNMNSQGWTCWAECYTNQPQNTPVEGDNMTYTSTATNTLRYNDGLPRAWTNNSGKNFIDFYKKGPESWSMASRYAVKMVLTTVPSYSTY